MKNIEAMIESQEQKLKMVDSQFWDLGPWYFCENPAIATFSWLY